MTNGRGLEAGRPWMGEGGQEMTRLPGRCVSFITHCTSTCLHLLYVPVLRHASLQPKPCFSGCICVSVGHILFSLYSIQFTYSYVVLTLLVNM